MKEIGQAKKGGERGKGLSQMVAIKGRWPVLRQERPQNGERGEREQTQGGQRSLRHQSAEAIARQAERGPDKRRQKADGEDHGRRDCGHKELDQQASAQRPQEQANRHRDSKVGVKAALARL